jgi:hypothetical protein
MKAKTAFSKKDLIVVLCCTVFVLMNLGAITGGARRRAKEAVCLSNLGQWGVIFEMYANEYDGKNVAAFYEDGPEFFEHMWVSLLKPYYQTFDMCLCPATTKTWQDGIFTGPFVGWDFRWLEENPEFYEYYDGAYGSYGRNTWCSSGMEDLWYDETVEFEYVTVGGANRIPLFADCMFLGGFPRPLDEIPPYSDRWFMEPGVEGWHRKWFEDPNILPDPEDPNDWPEWMRDFKNY